MASTGVASRPCPTVRSGRSRRGTTRRRGRRTAGTSSRSSPAARRCANRDPGECVSRRASPFVLSLGLAAGCALKGDVRKVELQVQALRSEQERAAAEQAARLDSLRPLFAALQQALTAQQAYLVQMRGDVKTDLLAVQQQLVQVQELTGQSQQRITELRAHIEERAQQPVPPLDTGTKGGMPPPVGPSGNPAGPGPDRMYDLSLQQFRRGSLATARVGLREFLRVYPTHERAADALFYVGETWAPENADSAAAVYQQVVKSYPNSPRAPSALYKLGLLAEQRGDKAAARTYYARVIAGYPRSDEANLAHDKLQRLGRYPASGSAWQRLPTTAPRCRSSITSRSCGGAFSEPPGRAVGESD